jgi:hypothetical protein
MLSRFPQPSQNGIFLVPRDARDAADATALGQQRQNAQNLLLARTLAEEDRPPGRGESAVTGLTLKSLHAFLALADLLDIPLPIALKLPMIRASFIGTEISCLGKLLHLVSPWVVCLKFTSSAQHVQEGDHPKIHAPEIR